MADGQPAVVRYAGRVWRPRVTHVTPELTLGLLAVGVFLALAATGGGSTVSALAPAAIFFLGLVVLALLLGIHHHSPRAWLSAVAFAFLAAYTVWSFVSISWAEAQGPAWEGANRTLAYCAVFALFALPRWRAGGAAIILGTYAIGLAIVAFVALAGTAALGDPETSLIASRFSEPVGYHNAVAALFLAGAWPAAYLASRREVHPALRGLLLASAGVLVQVALIPQSRGSALAVPVVAVIYAVLVPDRVRAILTLVPVITATVLAAGVLLDVFGATLDKGGLEIAFDDALRVVALSGLALFVVGFAAGIVDRRAAAWPKLARRTRLVGAIAICAVALAGAAAGLAAIGNPATWVDERWQEVKGGVKEESSGSTRFSGGFDGARYDFWRVAVDAFEEQPVAGIGSENFAIDYLRERRSDQEPLHPHSLELRLLSQTGLVGTALFAGFLGFALAAAAAARYGTRDRMAAGGVAIAVVAASYWLVHGSGDWFWEIPALATPAFAWLGMAGRIDGSPAPAVERPAKPRRLTVVAIVLISLTAATSFVLPWGAARDVELAAENWRVSAETAYDRLDRALDLNPLSDRAALIGMAIASRREEYGLMRHYLEIALERTSASWYAHLELGALNAIEGDRKGAREHLLESLDLNPREPVTADVLAKLRRGRRPSLAAIDRAFLIRVCNRFGRTDATPHCD